MPSELIGALSTHQLTLSTGLLEDESDGSLEEDPLRWTEQKLTRTQRLAHEENIMIRFGEGHLPVGVEAQRNRIGTANKGITQKIVSLRETAWIVKKRRFAP